MPRYCELLPKLLGCDGTECEPCPCGIVGNEALKEYQHLKAVERLILGIPYGSLQDPDENAE